MASRNTMLPTSGPALVQQFVVYCYKHIRDQNYKDVETMYTLTFNKISADFFPNTPWPHQRMLEHLVNDEVFWILYNELYYRHLHRIDTQKTREVVTVQDYKGSWENYLALSKLLLEHAVNMKLPNIWLWDMIDEFMYQFQKYTYFKCRLPARTPEEVAFIKENPDVWSPVQVQRVLEAFIEKSDIRAQLAADNGKLIYDTEGFVNNGSNVLLMMGYFSLLGLSRFFCLVGKYEDSIRALAPLNPFIRQNLYTFRIPLANIGLYYYAGMSFLMLRRYIDAGRCFNTILSFIYRVKDQNRTSASFDQILKKNEQMYQLLGICAAMCPAVARWLEENVSDQLKAKLDGEMNQMQAGDLDKYEKTFAYGCPKFVSTAAPDFEGNTDSRFLGYQAQKRLFLSEVASLCVLKGFEGVQAEAAHELPTLKSYLKLYTSITTEKLAQLVGAEESALMRVLASMQARNTQKCWVAGDALSGQVKPTTDVDFRIEKSKTGQDVVVVREQRMQTNHLATLAKHITRFEQITRDMEVHVAEREGRADRRDGKMGSDLSFVPTARAR